MCSAKSYASVIHSEIKLEWPPSQRYRGNMGARLQSPLTLSVQQINGLVLRNAPPIQTGDNLLMEANRGDFDLALLLSNGKIIVTGPHARLNHCTADSCASGAAPTCPSPIRAVSAMALTIRLPIHRLPIPMARRFLPASALVARRLQNLSKMPTIRLPVNLRPGMGSWMPTANSATGLRSAVPNRSLLVRRRPRKSSRWQGFRCGTTN